MTWEEIEFLENGDIEVEKFISNGEIKGEEALKELFERETVDDSIIEKINDPKQYDTLLSFTPIPRFLNYATVPFLL